MKEVIIIVPYFTNGGAERVLSELIPIWVENGIRITLIETAAEVFESNYTLSSKVEIIRLKNHDTRSIHRFANVVSLIRIIRRRPDATILVFNKTIFYRLAFVMPFIRNRVVVSERCDPYTDPPNPNRRRLRDRVFEKADMCVFQTPDAQGYFSDAVKKKSKIIPNPINPHIPERYEGAREKKIVAAGRLTEQKNFPMLLEAFAIVHKDFPDYRLVIFGRGELEGLLKETAAKLGISEYVDLPGFSSNIFEDIRKCAVYASSSDYEGISNSMLEALALGLPSVVTDCPAGGAKMVIKDHVNGILVPVGDAQAMAKGIREILSDSAFAESLGKEASRIRDAYPVSKIAKEWLPLF